MKHFPEYAGLNLSDVNKEINEFWKENDTFRRSVDEREGGEAFVFYEGPPSANGMPGIHHVMARTIKDVFCRYKTMQGFQVARKAGWDTHGLPVELGVEKMLGITKEDIGKKISVDEYNAACRREVMKYTREWEDLTEKMGYWVDMENPYITYDNKYIETLWWLLKQLYDKGLLYKGYTIQPYSPAAGTGLSSHELNQPGCYKDVKDRTAVAMFRLISPTQTLPSGVGLKVPPVGDLGGFYLLAWTTTPWTLPSNTALCVGENIIYNFIKTEKPYTNEPCVFILAKERVSAYFGEKKIENFEILGEVLGKDLVGLEYEQLIPFVSPSPLNPPQGDFLLPSPEGKDWGWGLNDKPYNTANPATYGVLKENAKNRRKNPTEAENFLWKNLQNKQFEGYKFRREHIIGDFIVDFVCLAKQLVVEIDGGYHNEKNQQEIDKIRTEYLNDRGFKVIRFTNEDVLYNIEKTLESIKEKLQQNSNLQNFTQVDLLPPLRGGSGWGFAFRVISGDFVTTEDGTGIVHIAPTFGADDDKVAKQNGIVPMLLTDKNGKQVPMVDLTGKFYKIDDLDDDFVKNNVNVELYKNFAGKFVKKEYESPTDGADLQSVPETTHRLQIGASYGLSLDDEICIWLKDNGLLFKSEKHTHNYPHCWRTDKPVLYYPLDSWFIRSTAVKDEMIDLNNTINWKPASTGTGRFGKWLENLNDWNLSRSRYWGTPLPIWRTEDGTEEICIGSMEELFAEIEKALTAGVMNENPFPNFKVGDYSAENYSEENIDLHRPYVDNIILVSPSGKPMKRELDLIDVWFDSGAMPFAQVHYPFESE